MSENMIISIGFLCVLASILWLFRPVKLIRPLIFKRNMKDVDGEKACRKTAIYLISVSWIILMFAFIEISRVFKLSILCMSFIYFVFLLNSDTIEI